MAFPFPKRRDRSWWSRPGLSRPKRRALDVALVLLVLGFGAAWAYGLTLEATDEVGFRPGLGMRLAANPLSPEAPPEAAFLLDAAVRAFTDVEALRGESGALRVVIPGSGGEVLLPDSIPGDVGLELRRLDGDTASPAGDTVRLRPDGSAGRRARLDAAGRPGAWGIFLRRGRFERWIPGLHVLVPVPMSRKTEGRIGRYLIGQWPFEEGGTPPSEAYRTPGGLIEVTPENRDLAVSEHFVLGDFLTKGQPDVWPKYVALDTRLLDKVELVIQELEEMGHPVEEAGVISGFRTPHYNVGGGNPSGRGSLSRHMYGDALDFYIDNDGDGRMDDLTGDGRVDIADARVIARAAERVEREHPSLVGGIGVYAPTGAHSGFVHVDTRGYRARW